MPKESTLAPSVFISLLNSEYEVKLPNTGQELDVAILLQQMSNEKYESFKLSYLPSMQREAVKLETMAYFNVLIPKLKADLTVKSLYELKRDQMDALIDAYLNQFLPWFEEWQVTFNKPKATEEEAKKPDETK